MAPASAVASAARKRAQKRNLGWGRRILLLGVVGGVGVVALRALYAMVPPRQVCPDEGATAEPCRKGQIAPYVVDLDVACFASQEARLASTLRERVGDTSGKKLPLWLTPEHARVMRSAPCTLSVTRDYNCTVCAQLNMSAPLASA